MAVHRERQVKILGFEAEPQRGKLKLGIPQRGAVEVIRRRASYEALSAAVDGEIL